MSYTQTIIDILRNEYAWGEYHGDLEDNKVDIEEFLSFYCSGTPIYLGHGMEAIVFDLNTGKVVRISYSLYQLPVEEWVNQKIACFHISGLVLDIFPKADTLLTSNPDGDDVLDQLYKESNGRFWDNHEANVGWIEGRWKVIDPGAITFR